VRRVVLVLYALVLLFLIATSSPRLVGDGGEYRAMAVQLASGHVPRPGATSHFLAYSALAVPGIWVTHWMGTNDLYAFTALNVSLLLSAAFVALRRLHWSAVLLVFVSPILWWVDKAHTEPFTFSLVTITLVLCVEQPSWAFVAAGLAATQNPPFALLVVVVALVNCLVRPAIFAQRCVRLALLVGIALSLLHPLYYSIRVGRLTSLSGNILWHWPNLREFLTIVIDPNLGLVVAFPVLALVVVGALVIVLWHEPAAVLVPEVMVAAAAAVLFLLSASQVANVNHGGTPGMSRYATWLIPVAIPLLGVVQRSRPAMITVLVPVAILSAAMNAVAFRPAVPEDGMEPSAVARWLWTHHPGLDTPLPEVFVERLGGGAEDNWLPVSTPGCEKVLVVGRGPSIGEWPVWCPPEKLPDVCTIANQVCYANRRPRGGYDFVVWTSRALRTFRVHRELVWKPSALNQMCRLVSQLRTLDLAPRPIGSSGAMVGSTRGVARSFLLQAAKYGLLYVDGIEAGAQVDLTSTRTTAWLMDPDDGHVLETFPASGGATPPPIRLNPSASPQLLVVIP